MTKLIVKNLINILNCINKLLLDFLSWRDLTFSLLHFQNYKLGKIECLKWHDFAFGLPRFHGGPARFSILDGEFPHVRRRDSTFYNAKFIWLDLKFYMLRRDWTNRFFVRFFDLSKLASSKGTESLLARFDFSNHILNIRNRYFFSKLISKFLERV